MKSRRNRIVIDLDKARADQQGRMRDRRSGRAGRILAIIAIVLVFMIIGVAAGGFFWWRNYKAQPGYTLALLVDAAQRNDKQEIDRLLDMDKIAESFVSDVRSRLTGSSILNTLLPSQVDQIAAQITPKLKQTLSEVLPGEIQRVTEPAKGKPFILIAMSVPYLADIKKNGPTATADFKFNNEQIQITMQQSGQAWRVVSIKDDRLANIIAETARKGAWQRGSEFKDEIERRLKELKLPGASPSP